MSYQIIVREIKPASTPGARELTASEVAGVPVGFRGEQVYEQFVEVLDLAKLVALVNAKPRAPRVYKPRTARNPNLTPG